MEKVIKFGNLITISPYNLIVGNLIPTIKGLRTSNLTHSSDST